MYDEAYYNNFLSKNTLISSNFMFTWFGFLLSLSLSHSRFWILLCCRRCWTISVTMWTREPIDRPSLIYFSTPCEIYWKILDYSSPIVFNIKMGLWLVAVACKSILQKITISCVRPATMIVCKNKLIEIARRCLKKERRREGGRQMAWHLWADTTW